MKLEQSFEVSAPVERVWDALIDVERVAPCLPGAAVTGRNDDGTYSGTFSVKIGPTSASYTGKLSMQDLDEAAHRATMEAHGTDKRGQGGADATIVSTLTALDAGGTRVEVSTDYRITGRLARFGRGGMIEDISEKLLRTFAANLQESLTSEPSPAPSEENPASTSPNGVAQPEETATSQPTAPPPPPPAASAPLDAGSLIGSVIKDRVTGNPLPLVVALGALLLLLLRSRRGREARRS